MKFTPKTNEEIQAARLLPDGEYDFEIIDAQDGFSKKGAEMMTLALRIFSDSGNRQVKDYIVDSMEWKLKHFAEAIGLLPSYELGQLLPEDCIGRSGKCQIVTQIDKTGQYGPRNSVRDYITLPGLKQEKPNGTQIPSYGIPAGSGFEAPPLTDDDIPF